MKVSFKFVLWKLTFLKAVKCSFFMAKKETYFYVLSVHFCMFIIFIESFTYIFTMKMCFDSSKFLSNLGDA